MSMCSIASQFVLFAGHLSTTMNCLVLEGPVASTQAPQSVLLLNRA